ncbi:MAG: HD domain-containing protein [Bacteroidales bacterium]
MDQKYIIQKTISFVKETLADAEGGHDWWHIYRVWNLSKQIARNEKADMLVIELGALLHDIADAKFFEGDEDIGPLMAVNFLSSIGVDQQTVSHVENIIRHISFKGGIHPQEFTSVELKVLQDADRLDAIGAIGIARAFNFGGHKGRQLYNPEIKPQPGMTKEQYKKSTAPTINHFYEKLLLLKDRMNTRTGRAMAEQRHLFMEQFLEQFFGEWRGDS